VKEEEKKWKIRNKYRNRKVKRGRKTDKMR
jgi:hypothetical protein